MISIIPAKISRRFALLIVIGLVCTIEISLYKQDYQHRSDGIKNFEVLAVKSRLKCNDVMRNLPNGRWVHWSKFTNDTNSEEYKTLEKEERIFDDYMNKFRIERGIHTRLWRDDLKCGLKNKQTKPKGNAWGGSVGAWCDARSDKPCCSNENNGTCGLQCSCPQCIDMRKILHAEFAKWAPFDSNCNWKNHSAEEACDVMKKFSEVHFVGDSFLRKMVRVMILILRSDPNTGAMLKRYDEAMKKKCVGFDQLFWTECRMDSVPFNNLLVDNSPLCGMDLSRFQLHGEYHYNAGTKMTQLVKRLAGKPGSLIIVGVGGHMNCEAQKTFEIVVKPFHQYLNEFYTKLSNTTSINDLRWPHVIYMFPDTPDVLKSPDYRAANGKIPCYKFTDQMIQYLTEAGISYLDFRKVTSDVHSYDGTHHGIGVNVQKVQILLNYLESLQLETNI